MHARGRNAVRVSNKRYDKPCKKYHKEELMYSRVIMGFYAVRWEAPRSIRRIADNCKRGDIFLQRGDIFPPYNPYIGFSSSFHSEEKINTVAICDGHRNFYHPRLVR